MRSKAWCDQPGFPATFLFRPHILPFPVTIYKGRYWRRFVLSKCKRIQMENCVDTISPEIAFILLGWLGRNGKYNHTCKNGTQIWVVAWNAGDIVSASLGSQTAFNLTEVFLQNNKCYKAHALATHRQTHAQTRNWAHNLAFLGGSEFRSCYSKGNVYFRDCKVVKHCFKSFFIFIFFKKKV